MTGKTPFCGVNDGVPRFRRLAHPDIGGMAYRFRCCSSHDCYYQKIEGDWAYCMYAVASSSLVQVAPMPVAKELLLGAGLKHCA